MTARWIPRSFALGVVGALATFSAFAGVVVPAQAADSVGVLSVSQDGVTFVPQATFNLFDGIDRVVPGDTMTGQLWVRNETHQPGRLRLDLIDAHASDRALAVATHVSFVTSGQNIAASIQEGIDAGACLILSDGIPIAAGETITVTSNLSIDAKLGELPNQTGDAGASAEVGFSFRAVLSDASVDASVFPGDSCHLTPEPVPSTTGSASGPLAETGTSMPVVAIVVGAAAISAGIIAARRRTAREERS